MGGSSIRLSLRLSRCDILQNAGVALEGDVVLGLGLTVRRIKTSPAPGDGVSNSWILMLIFPGSSVFWLISLVPC
jgi:hypothetical protein